MAATDTYAEFEGAPDAPKRKAASVSPNDSTDLAQASLLYIGVSGDVTVNTVGGSTSILFKAHPAGYMPVQVTRVYATGTTATNIVALFD